MFVRLCTFLVFLDLPFSRQTSRFGPRNGSQKNWRAAWVPALRGVARALVVSVPAQGLDARLVFYLQDFGDLMSLNQIQEIP